MVPRASESRSHSLSTMRERIMSRMYSERLRNRPMRSSFSSFRSRGFSIVKLSRSKSAMEGLQVIRTA